MRAFSLLVLALWLAACNAPVCGDGIIDAGEACDDGNDQNADGCQANCALPFCGDGIEDNGQGEGCDDGNTDDGDACPSSCEVAFCGDGFTERGTEDCDDANNSDNDACLTNCRANLCGDGILNPAAEQCDDGNLSNGDGCDANCIENRVVQVSASDKETCIVSNTGGVRCWGFNVGSQLGYQDNEEAFGDNETPAAQGDLNLGGVAVQVAAGGDHTCALLESGAVRCWGFSGQGQLGYGNTNLIGDNEAPASAGDVPLLGPAFQIAAGGLHACALLVSGDVQCWGFNTSGQLGYGNTTNIGDNEPANAAGLVDLGGAAIQIEIGGFHTCALLTTGGVRCWGNGNNGRLGLGNLDNIGDDETPADIGDIDLGRPAIGIATGTAHSCALLDNRTVRCWGLNNAGQLGLGNTTDIGDNEFPSAALEVNLGRDAVQLTAGADHTCALLDKGEVRCWGGSDLGQLGYGNTSTIGDNETPASAGSLNLGGKAVQISAGLLHTCAVLDTGDLRCWGFNDLGQLGYGNTSTIGDNETPADLGDVPVF